MSQGEEVPENKISGQKDDSPTASISISKDMSREALVRQSVGTGMHAFSDLVNDNLVAARFATVATVSLIAAYGMSNTPLFFRYTSVREIPTQHFLSRKRLRARLIKIIDNDQAGQPIVCFVRHLSPAGQLLNRELFEFGMKAAPSAQVSGRAETADLIKVELGVSVACVRFYHMHVEYRHECPHDSCFVPSF
jgi:hypothetical protein